MRESEYPNAHGQDVPWWWKEDRRNLREREEKILEQREVYKLQTYVASAYGHSGYEPDEVTQLYPDFSLGDVHRALTYYYDDIDEL